MWNLYFVKGDLRLSGVQRSQHLVKQLMQGPSYTTQMALGPMRVIVLREYLIGLEHLVGMRVRGVCGILATQIAMLGL
jgi:hypothetical protein